MGRRRRGGRRAAGGREAADLFEVAFVIEELVRDVEAVWIDFGGVNHDDDKRCPEERFHLAPDNICPKSTTCALDAAASLCDRDSFRT